MKRIHDERPIIPLTGNSRENADAQGRAGASGTDARQTPARHAELDQGAEQALPPMVFPGPLAFHQAPVMLPVANAPYVTAMPDWTDLPAAADNSAAKATSGSLGVDGPEVKASGMALAYVTPKPDDPPLVRAARLGDPRLVKALLDGGHRSTRPINSAGPH
jgi:hypothetical protein